MKCKRTANLLMFISDFRKKGVCSKSFTETLYGNKILVSECIFKLVCHCENCRLSDRLTVCKRYGLAYLKKQPPELFCRKMCFLKILQKGTCAEVSF